MAKDGIKSYALDMPGSGYSSWPQPGYDFEFSGDSVKGKELSDVNVCRDMVHGMRETSHANVVLFS